MEASASFTTAAARRWPTIRIGAWCVCAQRPKPTACSGSSRSSRPRGASSSCCAPIRSTETCFVTVRAKGKGTHARTHLDQHTTGEARPTGTTAGTSGTTEAPAATGTSVTAEQPASSNAGIDPVFNHSVDMEPPLVHSEQQPVNQDDFAGISRQPRLRLPPANNTKFYKGADKDLKVILAAITPKLIADDINTAAEQLDSLLYGYFAERCGTQRQERPARARPGTAPPARPKQDQWMLDELEQQRTYARPAGSSSTPAYNRINRQTKKLKRMVAQNDQQQKAEQERRKFKQNPHEYAAGVFRPKSDKKPTFTKAAADAFFSSTYEDKHRSRPYDAPPGLPRPAAPRLAFNQRPPSDDEIVEIIRRKPNRSAPGLSGITYVIFKRCESARAKLCEIVQHVWHTSIVPRAWQLASIILIAKSDQLDLPKEFRPIALLNVAGKVFFSVVNKRLESYMIGNGYINLAVQKAFTTGVPGCLEHTARLAEALRLAKENRREINVVFLDLENAYGSPRHNFIQFALHWYHLPRNFCTLVYNYYEHQLAQVHTDGWTSDWFQLAIGVYQGCTGSTGLFNLLFNVLLDALAQPEYRQLGFRLASDADPMYVAGYADDVTLVAESPGDCQRLVDRFQEMLSWTGTMRLKPAKCRSFGMRKFINGRPVTRRYNIDTADERTVVYTPAQQTVHSSFDPQLTAVGTPIKFIGHDTTPFKFLGMFVSHDLTDTYAREKLSATLNTLLELVDARPLSGWMKVWLYNYYVATKLSWMLMIYDLPLGVIEDLEATCNRYLKKWFGLTTQGAVTEVMYLKQTHHGRSVHSMVTLYKRLQAIKLHLLANSRDGAVKQMFERQKAKVRNMSRKYDAFKDFEQKETFLLNSEALNEQVRRRSGLGHRDRQEHKPVLSAAARRRLISEHIADVDDQARVKRLREKQMQGRFVDWNSVMGRDFSWRRLFTGAISDNVLNFAINAQLHTLPSESNKRRWQMIPVDSHCRLKLVPENGSPALDTCGTPNPTEMHVLCSCPGALTQGRYTWRHNSVLLVIKSALIPHLRAINTGKIRIAQAQPPLRFKSADTGAWYNGGESAPTLAPKTLRDWLALASDWQLQCDLKGDSYYYRNGMFPPEVASTGKRPDLLLLSPSEKIALCIELTVPNEENVLHAHARKSNRYKELEEEAAANGWRLSTWPIEVGARGFVAWSTWYFLKALFTKAQATAIKRQLELVALRCSYYLFVSRGEALWQDVPLLAAAADRTSSSQQRGS
eukprot:TRINITY_DN288_c0_g1_i4.p1 TRINITY_DN288_c0_g1~~TRINITY_DN288_c0_g1_i4.p1  ORF type:complete len:1252 (-),score=337.45 TRINITY_DN288_c0_g1_i4:506-4261(-)